MDRRRTHKLLIPVDPVAPGETAPAPSGVTSAAVAHETVSILRLTPADARAIDEVVRGATESTDLEGFDRRSGTPVTIRIQLED